MTICTFGIRSSIKIHLILKYFTYLVFVWFTCCEQSVYVMLIKLLLLITFWNSSMCYFRAKQKQIYNIQKYIICFHCNADKNKVSPADILFYEHDVIVNKTNPLEVVKHSKENLGHIVQLLCPIAPLICRGWKVGLADHMMRSFYE